MLCYGTLMIAGIVYFLITSVVGEMFHFAEDAGMDLLHGLDGALEHIGIDLIHDVPMVEGSDMPGANPFSGRTVAGFATFFGATGSILSNIPPTNAWPYWSVPLVSLGAGLVGWFLVWMLGLVFAKQQASSHYGDADIVGITGRVTVSIPKDALGTVTLNVRNQTLSMGARSQNGEEIAQGTTVQVVAKNGATLVVKQKETADV